MDGISVETSFVLMLTFTRCRCFTREPAALLGEKLPLRAHRMHHGTGDDGETYTP
jgi:hypothetical protein